jgi:ribose transport system permease protein
MFIVTAVLLGMQTSGRSLLATIREWIVWTRA